MCDILWNGASVGWLVGGASDSILMGVMQCKGFSQQPPNAAGDVRE